MEKQEIRETQCFLKSTTEEVVPLYHVDTHVDITDNIAKIQMAQYYLNLSDDPLEMEYSQPVHAKVVYGGFEMKVGDRTLISQVRSRKEA